MTEADIKDGDHALPRHVQIPKNGEIMLVRHDDSSTLKRIAVGK
jgi:SOS-response transcriptional repressor LexA